MFFEQVLNLNFAQYVAIAFTNVGAAWVNSSIGMGGAIVSIPILLWIVPAQQAIPLSNTLAITRDIFLIQDAKEGVKHRLVFPLLIGSLIGSIVGYYFLSLLKNDNIIRIAGIAIILYEIYYIFFYSYINRDKVNEDTDGLDVEVPHKFEKVNSTFFLTSFLGSFLPHNWFHLIAGTLSGIMTGTIGMGGPILAAYLRQVVTNSNVIRTTLIAFFTVNGFLQILIMFVTGIMRLEYLIAAAVCLPFVAFGTWKAKEDGADKTPWHAYRFAISILIIIAALTLIFRSFL